MANKKISELTQATSVSETDVLVGNHGTTTQKIPISVLRALLGLPVVSSSDNGKFLTVSQGAWAATTVTNAENTSY